MPLVRDRPRRRAGVLPRGGHECPRGTRSAILHYLWPPARPSFTGLAVERRPSRARTFRMPKGGDQVTPDARKALEALRRDISKMPTREDWLGGQRTRYVQRDEVLGYIDAHFNSWPVETPPTTIEKDVAASVSGRPSGESTGRHSPNNSPEQRRSVVAGLPDAPFAARDTGPAEPRETQGESDAEGDVSLPVLREGKPSASVEDSRRQVPEVPTALRPNAGAGDGRLAPQAEAAPSPAMPAIEVGDMLTLEDSGGQIFQHSVDTEADRDVEGYDIVRILRVIWRRPSPEGSERT